MRSFAIFAIVLRMFALVVHFDFCLILSATDHLGGPVRNARSKKKCTFTIFW